MPSDEQPFDYVSFDRERDLIRLRLPPDQEPYRQELLEELADEFSFEPRTPAVEKRMNEYVRTWITRRHGDPSAGAAH
jgi:hypothetical protein